MIKIIDHDDEDNSTNFLIHSVKTNIVNSMRRVMLTEYKNHAFNINNIDIEINNSLLHNDLLKHRISLIPIYASQPITIELDVENKTNKMMNIYSNDFKIKSGNGKINQNILLLKLKKNQSIKFTATSDLNNCKNGGTIYKPIENAFFKIIKQISIKSDLNSEKIKNIKTFLINEKQLLNETKIMKYNTTFTPIGALFTIRDNSTFINFLCKKFTIAKTDILIEDLIYENDPVYFFCIESFYINPKIILIESLNILKKKFEDFLNFDIEIEETNDSYKFYIKNECSTILHPIAYFLRDNNDINYAFYNKIHILDDFTILQFSLKNQHDNYSEILKKTLSDIINYINNILNNKII